VIPQINTNNGKETGLHTSENPKYAIAISNYAGSECCECKMKIFFLQMCVKMTEAVWRRLEICM